MSLRIPIPRVDVEFWRKLRFSWKCSIHRKTPLGLTLLAVILRSTISLLLNYREQRQSKAEQLTGKFVRRLQECSRQFEYQSALSDLLKINRSENSLREDTNFEWIVVKQIGLFHGRYKSYAKQTRMVGSSFALNENDMIAEFRLNWWIGVDWFGDGADGKCKGCILERTHHSSADLPAQVTASSRFVFRVRSRYIGKLFAGFELLKCFEYLRLLLAKDVSNFNGISTFRLLGCES